MLDDVTKAQFDRLIEVFRDPLDKTIYHYTSPEGFRGIVTSGEIWLTNAAFVNDTTECKLFWEVAAPSLKDERLPNRFVQDVLGKRRRPENDTYYIAAFSQKEDSLSQYRAYGSFCIGFDPRKMNRAGFNLYRCVYTEQDIKEWIREKSRMPEWDECPDYLRVTAAYNLLFAAEMKYKSEHYSDEREVRVVSLSNHTWKPYVNSPSMFEKDPPIHFRDHPVHKIPLPYVKFFISPGKARDDPPWQKCSGTEEARQMKQRKLHEEGEMSRELLPITDVWIGPMAHQEEAKLACEIILKEKGYESVPVQVSNIPYRGV